MCLLNYSKRVCQTGGVGLMAVLLLCLTRMSCVPCYRKTHRHRVQPCLFSPRSDEPARLSRFHSCPPEPLPSLSRFQKANQNLPAKLFCWIAVRSGSRKPEHA